MVANNDRILYRLVGLTLLFFLVCAYVAEEPGLALPGFLRLQLRPSRLNSDFAALEGPGAALLNAACVGALGMIFLGLQRVRLSGPTLAPLFAMMGFAFFGKTVLTCIPIMLGVGIAARLVGKSPREYSIIAMFGTALGPIVTFVAFETGLPPLAAWPLAILAGIALGIVLPAVAIELLHLHQGYNLYNVGMSAGFLALFAAAAVANAGGKMDLVISWYNGRELFFVLLVPLVSLLFVAAGLGLGGGHAFRDWWTVQKCSGRLPSDFMEMVSMPAALLNMGLLGLSGCAYVKLVGADFSGPVLAGLLMLLGFGAFGKTLKNILPVMLGVIVASLVFGLRLSDPRSVVTLLFCTGLAPMAGEFGPVIGILAGFVHFLLVDRTSAWYGGLNLYNNGFSAGLTAALFVAVIEWYRSNRGTT